MKEKERQRAKHPRHKEQVDINGSLLKEIINKKGLSMEMVSRYIDRNEGYIGQNIKRNRISRPDLEKICGLLKIPMERVARPIPSNQEKMVTNNSSLINDDSNISDIDTVINELKKILNHLEKIKGELKQ